MLVCATLQGTDYTISVSGFGSRGWYNSDGQYSGNANANYFVGFPNLNQEFRNFFIFDLSLIPTSETVISATLSLYNPSAATGNGLDGYASTDQTENYQLFAVETTSLSDLASFASPLSTFTDLGSGLTYSTSTSVSSTDNDSYIQLTLNSAFLTAVQSSLGGEIALGGAITSLYIGTSTYAGLFTGSPHASGFNLTQLTITTSTVPEPGTTTMIAGAIVFAAAFFAKRLKRLPVV